MVAPGDCSPSRNVVSKMTTRSFSDGVVDIGLGPFRWRLGALMGSVGSAHPLSAQAHAPVRPSGDAKEQEPTKSEARPRTGQGQGPPGTSTNAAARRNHFCLVRPGQGLQYL